jgi:hypothetical protein
LGRESQLKADRECAPACTLSLVYHPRDKAMWRRVQSQLARSAWEYTALRMESCRSDRDLTDGLTS